MKRTVFVIDDYVDSLQLYVEAFSQEGLRPFGFRDPLSALTALRALRPGAILLDWHLPHLSGGEFIHELRARPEVQDVPVVVLTGDGRLRVRDTGAQAVLLKPVELTEVLSVLQGCLAAEAPQRAEMKSAVGDWRVPE